MSKTRKIAIGIIIGILAVVLIAGAVFFMQMCRMMASMGPVEQTYVHENHQTDSGSAVYMTADISPEGPFIRH